MAKKKTGVELEFSILDDGFSKSIKDMNTALSSMKKELNLENEVLKNSSATVNDYKNKLQTLKEQEELSRQKVEKTREAYEKVKNILGENSVEATKYKNKLSEAELEHQKITNAIDKTEKSLSEQEEALKDNEKKSRELNSTYGTLTSTINNQKEHLEDLKRQYISTVLEQGKGTTQAKNLKSEIKTLSTEIDINETKLESAKKELQKFAKEEDNAGKHAITFGEMIKANLISDVIKKGISELVNGVKQLGNQLLDLGKQSFILFSNYEQLVGGVDTLFKNSSLRVQKYANDAYKTAGLNANKYMETVTSFSASLLKSLHGDTKRAADIANMAIIDMSDNSNKMGTNMTAIQNAYQGFAKQNYTMLDNLKLGYGGTKTEMERLLADAQKLTGIKYNISNLSDVYQAIHVIQSELGITGTTAKEASSTIQGSIATMKSAGQNLLTGIADSNADHEQLVQNFVNSIIGENGEGGVIGNIVPRIRIMIDGIKKIFSELWNQLPKIAEQIPEIKPLVDFLMWIKDNGKVIISILVGIGAAMAAFKIASIIIALVSGFKSLFAVIKAGKGVMAALNIVMNANPIALIVMAIAGLVAAFITLWNTSEEFRNFWIGLWNGIVNIVSGAIAGVKNFFAGIINFVKENWQGLLLFLVNPFAGAFKLLYDNCEKFRNFWIGLWNGIVNIVSGAIAGVKNFFMGIINFVKENWQGLLLFLVNPIAGAFKLLYDNCEEFRNFVNNFVQNVISFFQQIPTKISEFIQNAINFFQELPEKIGFIIGQILGHILKFGIDAYNWVVTEVPKIIDGIVTFFRELPSKVWNFLVDTFNKTKEWGASMVSEGKETASNFFNNVVNFFRQLSGKVWSFLVDTFNKTKEWGVSMVSKGKETATSFFNNVVNFFRQLPGKIWTFLTDIISKVVNWGINLVNKGKQAASNLFNGIVNTLKGLPNQMLTIGKNLVQGIWNGINNAKEWVLDKIKGFGKGIVDGIKSVFGIHSPSTVFRDQVGKNLALGLGEGFMNEMKDVTTNMKNAVPTDFDIGVNTNTLTNGYNNLLNNQSKNITDTSDYNPGQVAPIYLNIENFNNNREQDIEDLSEELEFYRMKINYGKGNA